MPKLSGSCMGITGPNLFFFFLIKQNILFLEHYSTKEKPYLMRLSQVIVFFQPLFKLKISCETLNNFIIKTNL